MEHSDWLCAFAEFLAEEVRRLLTGAADVLAFARGILAKLGFAGRITTTLAQELDAVVRQPLKKDAVADSEPQRRRATRMFTSDQKRNHCER